MAPRNTCCRSHSAAMEYVPTKLSGIRPAICARTSSSAPRTVTALLKRFGGYDGPVHPTNARLRPACGLSLAVRERGKSTVESDDFSNGSLRGWGGGYELVSEIQGKDSHRTGAILP